MTNKLKKITSIANGSPALSEKITFPAYPLEGRDVNIDELHKEKAKKISESVTEEIPTPTRRTTVDIPLYLYKGMKKHIAEEDILIKDYIVALLSKDLTAKGIITTS